MPDEIDVMKPGTAVQLAPGIRRLIAPNPGMMTGPGTNTYLIGEKRVAVIDPGPNKSEHIEAIQSASPGQICWILVTHTHPDHSPAAKTLAQNTEAELLGMPAPPHPPQDRSFTPNRILNHGDLLTTDEFVLETVHTPGHASNHLCYRHQEHNWLFTGDHVIEGSTVVINPPDGNMKDYLKSLNRAKALNTDRIAPGHGGVIEDPQTAMQWIIEHRLAREDKVVNALKQKPGASARELVPMVYQEISTTLYALAERSLLAHLIKLEEENRVACKEDRWVMADP